jgi:hypothetical protein
MPEDIVLSNNDVSYDKNCVSSLYDNNQNKVQRYTFFFIPKNNFGGAQRQQKRSPSSELLKKVS